MEADGSYSELFEYVMNAVSVVMLISCWFRTRQQIFLALSLVFTFTLADNFFQLHEEAGHALSAKLQASKHHFDDAPTALGELIFSVLVGSVMLGMVLWTTCRAEQSYQTYGAVFLLLLILLGGFGVGVDLLHSALLDVNGLDSWSMMGGPLDRLLGFVEDGGELIILSIICALSCAAYARLGDHLRDGKA